MKTRFAILMVLLAATVSQGAPSSANELIEKAGAQASREKKAVYVHFSASWCGWCKRHDAFLEQAAVKPVFEKYFVPVKLVVQENDENKKLENAGSDKWLEKTGGPEGLPFLAFLDAKGKLIVNSKRTNEKGVSGNIGHPFQPEEVDWFVTMMKKAAPTMAAADLKAIETALRSQKRE